MEQDILDRVIENIREGNSVQVTISFKYLSEGAPTMGGIREEMIEAWNDALQPYGVGGKVTQFVPVEKDRLVIITVEP